MSVFNIYLLICTCILLLEEILLFRLRQLTIGPQQEKNKVASEHLIEYVCDCIRSLARSAIVLEKAWSIFEKKVHITELICL